MFVSSGLGGFLIFSLLSFFLDKRVDLGLPANNLSCAIGLLMHVLTTSWDQQPSGFDKAWNKAQYNAPKGK